MRNVVFIKYSASIGNNLGMRPSRRNEAPMVVGWTNLPNHLYLVTVKILRSKWEVTKLQFNKAKKRPISKGCFSTSLSYNNCNERMQPTLGVHEEG